MDVDAIWSSRWWWAWRKRRTVVRADWSRIAFGWGHAQFVSYQTPPPPPPPASTQGQGLGCGGVKVLVDYTFIHAALPKYVCPFPGEPDWARERVIKHMRVQWKIGGGQTAHNTTHKTKTKFRSEPKDGRHRDMRHETYDYKKRATARTK